MSFNPDTRLVNSSLFLTNRATNRPSTCPQNQAHHIPSTQILPPPQSHLNPLAHTPSQLTQENLHAIYYYFTSLLASISMKLLIKSKKLGTIYVIVNDIIRKSSECAYLSELFQSFLPKLCCSKCNRTDLIIGFDCSHSLCTACFTLYANRQIIPHTRFEAGLVCPVCEAPVENSDFEMAFPDWSERERSCEKRERKQTRDVLECKQCFRVLQVSCYRGCRCYCFECQLDRGMLGICECESFDYQIVCDACKEVVRAPGLSKFAVFCTGHLHCMACIKKCYGEFRCLVCKEGLEQYDIRKVLRYAAKACEKCQGIYEIRYFASEGCCGGNCCVTCQAKISLTQCCNCRQQIDVRSILQANDLLV